MKTLKANRCCICGRELTSENSIARGTGDECAEKRAAFVSGCGTSETELATIAEHSDEYINRWARNFKIEMRNGNTRGAKLCLEAARRALTAEMRQAERVAEPMLRLASPAYAGEIARAYAGDGALQKDMLGELEVAA